MRLSQEVWVFVLTLFGVGAAVIALFSSRLGDRARQRELWAYFLSELAIVGAVLVPPAIDARLFFVILAGAQVRVAWELFRTSASRGFGAPVADATAHVLAMAGIASIAFIASGKRGPEFLVLMFVCTEMHDAMAFLFGRIFGKTRFLPRISPRKTLEGAVAGLIAGIAAGMAFALSLDLCTWPQALGIATICTFGGLCGDLLASAYKRQAGVKDFPPVSNLHGGLLDVYDALIFAGPPMLACLIVLGLS